MSKVVFDGDNKLIIVNSGTTDIDVGNDIYLEWKKWVLELDNSKYLAAFRAFGGEQTTLNQKSPNYYFLINFWKIKVENLSLNINYNLYSEDYSSPFDNINSTILLKNSDTPGISDVNTSLQDINTSLSDVSQTTLNIEQGISTLNLDISNSLQDINTTLTDVSQTTTNIQNDISNLSLDVKHILGLVQSNYRLSNHIYDKEGRLTSTKISIFSNATDCDSNINSFATYTMGASYNLDGLLIDYKVVKN